MGFHAAWIRAQFQLELPEIDVDATTAATFKTLMLDTPPDRVLECGVAVYANAFIPAGVAFFDIGLVAINADVLAAHGGGELDEFLTTATSSPVWRRYDLESIAMLDELTRT